MICKSKAEGRSSFILLSDCIFTVCSSGCIMRPIRSRFQTKHEYCSQSSSTTLKCPSWSLRWNHQLLKISLFLFFFLSCGFLFVTTSWVHVLTRDVRLPNYYPGIKFFVGGGWSSICLQKQWDTTIIIFHVIYERRVVVSSSFSLSLSLLVGLSFMCFFCLFTHVHDGPFSPRKKEERVK